MKNTMQKRLAFLLALALMMSLFSIPAYAEGDDSQGTGEKKAVRTIMLYDCGANLETYGGMATYNLMQILRANFSADDDVRFIVMTGGSEKWQTESKYLYDPAAGESPAEINTEYNQIWEARGLDAADPAQRGKLVLVDGDGVLGDGENAKPAVIQDEDLVYDEDWEDWCFDFDKISNYEWMSDPEVLKAFINFCTEKYPAENYDLILWDHGGGPLGGFGSDENDPGGGFVSMSFTEIVDALYDNDVVKGGGKFDFVDFDACLMNGVEFNLALAGCTKYYIASPETEPGYGQDYEGWLNALGKNPNMDTYALGKLIVDDFTAFYDKEEGDGSTQDGTLAVVDMEKLLESDFVGDLIELDSLLNKSSEWFYYDEFRSLAASMEYGDMDYVDLGNFVSQLGFAYKEANYGNLDENDQIIDSNDYTACAESLLAVLNDPSILYARGTKGIHTDAQYYRDADGTMKFGTQGTSGLYIFFPKSDAASEAADYYDMIGEILETMPAGDARTFLSNYRLTLLKYALVYYTGQAVTEMITEEEDKDAVEYGKGFDAVVDYWKGDPEDEEAQEYNMWDYDIEPIMDILIEAEGQEAVDEWMEINTWGMARDAILRNNVSVSAVKEASGISHTIRITDSIKQIVDSVDVNLIAELPAYENALHEYYPDDYEFFLQVLPGLQIGSIKGSLVCDVDPEKDGYEALVRWLLDDNSTWNLPVVEEKWYAIKDQGARLHAVDAEVENDGIYICTGYPEQVTEMTEDGPRTEVNWHIVYLQFVDGKLLNVYFQQDSGGYRDVPASELVGELELTPLVEINFFLSFYFPISEKSFKLSAENVKDISLVYTDVKNITDIRDTSGDGRGLTTQVVIRNVFGYDMDISDLVAAADNKVNGSGDVSDRFTDVSKTAWYHDAVQWAVDKGIMNGVADTLFAPNDVATRAMVVTMVWRMAGQPAVDYTLPFTDVPEGRWYTEAIRWAASTGAVNGTGADTFSPNAPVTREQLAAILYRYVQAQGEGFEGEWMFPLDYSDAASVSEWANEAMHWMTMNGIITGMGDGTLAPRDNATRAQIAAIFMRFCA